MIEMPVPAGANRLQIKEHPLRSANATAEANEDLPREEMISSVGLQAQLPATRLPDGRADRRSSVALLCALSLVGGCVVVGWWLTRHGVDLHLGSAFPLSGQYGLHAGPWLLPAGAVAIAGVVAGPACAMALRWPALLVGAFLGSAGWAVAVAIVAGPAAIAAPLAAHGEYLAEVDRVNAMGFGTFLDTFTRFIVGGPDAPEWATHVGGHPPMATLLFASLARAGLAGPGWAAAMCIAGGAAAAPAILSTLEVIAGEDLARHGAVFVVFAPAALWVATSADALFAGVAATGICALAHAARVYPTGPAGRPGRALALALVAGTLLGACLMLSYGLVLLTPIAVAVVLVGTAVPRGRLTVLQVAGVGAAAVVAAFAAAGFWWVDGLELARERVMNGPGWRDRPMAYFLFANPAAIAVAAGPVVVAALPLAARLRSWPAQTRRLVTPALAALFVMVVATASNLSKGEVERIYLPFTMWLLPLAVLLPRSSRPALNQDRALADPAIVSAAARGRSTRRRLGPDRRWLAAQVGWTLLIAVTTTLHW